MATIAYTRDNPSPRYQELERIYRQVHEAGLPGDGLEAGAVFTGKSLYDHIGRVRVLARNTGARTILDYGSGKGLLYTKRDFDLGDGTTITSVQDHWGVDEIRCFDPGVPQFAVLPDQPSDGVVCTDVLEHVPEEDIPWLLGELFRLARRFVYGNIAAFPASKTLPNGWNAHVTIRPPNWWDAQIRAAAENWTGQAYEFQVRERRTMPGVLRKITGLGKWKTTVITSGTSSHARSDG